MYVNIGHYGCESDGGVFQRTDLSTILEKRQYEYPPPANVGSAGPIPYLMVGDEAFPLKPYLMRPYPGRGNIHMQFLILHLVFHYDNVTYALHHMIPCFLAQSEKSCVRAFLIP